MKANFCIGLLIALIIRLLLLESGSESGLSSTAEAQIEQSAKSIETLADLKAAIEKVVNETGIPAASIALVNTDGLYWAEGFGMTDMANDTPADKNTMFRIASVSKMFVALAVLKLQEEGRLTLSDRVRDLVPEIAFQNRWEERHPIRVAHLLEHTTGWDEIHMPEYGHNDPTPATLKQALDFHPHSRISRWVPGTRMAYSNAGSAVAAFIIEKITEERFEDYVEENFFDPMGMENMSYFLTEAYLRLGANLNADGTPQDYRHFLVRPAGSITASANDMAKLVRFFVNRGAVEGIQLISQESLRRMETPKTSQGAKAGVQVGYALNNYSSLHKGFTYREHRGSMSGARARLAYLPEHGLGHAIMVGLDRNGAFKRISDLVRDFETWNLDKPTSPQQNEFRGDISALDGYYLEINPRAQWTHFVAKLFFQKISSDEQHVYISDLSEDKYYPASDSLWRSAETGLISIARVTDPLAGEVLHVGGLSSGTAVLKKVSALQALTPLIIAALWLAMMAGAILYALIWPIRLLRGSLTEGLAIRMRFWPLLAGVLCIAAVIVHFLWVNRITGPTYASIAVMLLTMAFAISAAYSVVIAVQARRIRMNALAYWHSAILACLHFIVASYCLPHGVIGFRAWA